MNLGHLTRGFVQAVLLTGAWVSFRSRRTYCAVFGHRWSYVSAEAWLRDGTPIRCERCGCTFEPYVGMK